MAEIIRNLSEEDESTEVWVEPDAISTSKILGYFGRINDRAQVRNAIVKRYGTGIKQTKDKAGNILETYTKAGFEERMLAGHIEVVTVGLGHSITAALATLFTEPGQRFALISPSGEEISDVAEWFGDIREDSQFIEGLVSADEEAVQLGCSVLWVEFYEGALRYRTVDPGKVKVRFDGAVESNGAVRPVDYRDLEDATCVIIETGTIDAETKSYLAIFGRSYEYPNGRYVAYNSDSDGKDVPDVSSETAYEWVNLRGQIANPLSQYANEHPDVDLPEYPLVMFYGGHVRRDRLFPLSLSLLEESIEADVSASHLRATSGDEARGSRVLTKSHENRTAPLPDHLYGEVSLEPGQTLDAVAGNANNSMIAWELLKEENIATAQGYSVPDYYVSSKDHTVEASSGVALKIRTGPLIKFRNTRAAINAPGVQKVFEIEKILISMFAEGDAGMISQLEAAGQQWDPGEKDLPEELKDVVETAETLYSRGVYDDIEYLRVVYNLPSEAEAIAKYEALKARREKYPPLKEEQVMDAGPNSQPFGGARNDTGSDREDAQDQAATN